jgi:hypothetical protein
LVSVEKLVVSQCLGCALAEANILEKLYHLVASLVSGRRLRFLIWFHVPSVASFLYFLQG